MASRRSTPVPGEVAAALRDRSLTRTWAMRGTLHALPSDVLGAFVALAGAARVWEKGSWQRTFATAGQLAAIGDAVEAALTGRELTREELVAEVTERTGDPALAEPLGSGWGALLKPLAWQGRLCHVSGEGARARFARPQDHVPGWAGLPDPRDAARTVIPAYLGAYGPASAETFDQWLTRGASRKPELRSWFAELGDELCTVSVEGRELYLLATDVDELTKTEPTEAVRLLPAFDQYVLGPGTGAPEIVDAHRRPLVSKAAGWISPIVVAGGRVAGTWEVDGSELTVAWFAEAGAVPDTSLAAEAVRVGERLGRPLELVVRTI